MANQRLEHQNSSPPLKGALPKVSKTIILLVVLAVLLVAVGAVVWIKYVGPGASVTNENSLSDGNIANATIFRTGPASNQPTDSDGDGLTDEEEQSLKTDPNKSDTDGDGLYDLDEVKGYHTDPLKSDTDGDGFSDGDEVSNRYNPNGPGSLLDLDSAVNTNSPS